MICIFCVVNALLINFKPQQFWKTLAGIALKLLLVFLAGGAVFYALEAPGQRQFVQEHLYIGCLAIMALVGIAILQTWRNGAIFIYKVERVGDQLHFWWQNRGQLHDRQVPLGDVLVRMIPSGKDSPFLEITLGAGLELNQTIDNTWNKKVMQEFVRNIDMQKRAFSSNK